jgi:hypothetical protein
VAKTQDPVAYLPNDVIEKIIEFAQKELIPIASIASSCKDFNQIAKDGADRGTLINFDYKKKIVDLFSEMHPYEPILITLEFLEKTVVKRVQIEVARVYNRDYLVLDNIKNFSAEEVDLQSDWDTFTCEGDRYNAKELVINVTIYNLSANGTPQNTQLVESKTFNEFDFSLLKNYSPAVLFGNPALIQSIIEESDFKKPKDVWDKAFKFIFEKIPKPERLFIWSFETSDEHGVKSGLPYQSQVRICSPGLQTPPEYTVLLAEEIKLKAELSNAFDEFQKNEKNVAQSSETKTANRARLQKVLHDKRTAISGCQFKIWDALQKIQTKRREAFWEKVRRTKTKGLAGGSKQKILYKGRMRLIHYGKRGGKYVKVSGKLVSVKRA